MHDLTSPFNPLQLGALAHWWRMHCMACLVSGGLCGYLIGPCQVPRDYSILFSFRAYHIYLLPL